MAEHHPEPTLIPIPPDFPVTWVDPGDEHLPFMLDRLHTPSPVTPLTGSLHEVYFSQGASKGFESAGQPLGFHVRRINTYYYLAIAPSVPPEEMEAAGAHAEATLKNALGNFADRWDNEWVPEIQGYHDTWDGFDLQGASISELFDHMEWTLSTWERFWAIHMEVTVPYIVAPSMFHDLYVDLFGGDQDLEAYKLLQGTDNSSLAAGRALWALSRRVKADPELTMLIRETDAAHVMGTLAHSETGRAFIPEIEAFLEAYGKRSDTVIELADPSWIEEPKTAIELLKNYLSDSAEDPDIRWRELIEERERLVAEAREKLESYPEAVKGQFEMLLLGGQQGHRIQEDHNWWLDQQGLHRLRRVFLEVGNRFAAAGVIAEPSDIFYLTIDEIREVAAAGMTGDRKAQIAAEKADMERWAGVSAPPWVGTDYGPPPDNPVGNAISKFFGGPPRPPSEENPDVFGGTPGSPGKIRATARVIIKLEDAGKLNQGEILVTATTSPPWTPLFATAGGIVTDTGGSLSHCAIVAREYGIPAVVGTGMATALVADGQTLEIDGDTGEVRLIPDG